MIYLNKIYALLGATGTGKSTLGRYLEEEYGIPRAISYTTKKRRSDEVEGVDYYYVSDEELDKLNKIEEVTREGGVRYSFAVESFEKAFDKSDECYIIVDREGIKQIRKVYPNITVIFIYSTPDEVRDRIKKRSKSVHEYMKARKRYLHDIRLNEFNNLDIADYVVINRDGELERTFHQLDSYIVIEQLSEE